ncbi:tetratricopeptide repeat protein [Candidatus Sumerlaeota bacterium]|nr:tetratricopeptide repeat protein [Candidatus Sumerlaeota bacterium]
MDGLWEAADRWVTALGVVSWQASVLTALIGLIVLMWRKASPAVRYALWCVVLVRLLAPVGLSSPIGLNRLLDRSGSVSISQMPASATVPVVPRAGRADSKVLPVPMASASAGASTVDNVASQSSQSAVFAFSAIRVSPTAYVAGVWSLMVLGMMGFIANRVLRTQCWLASCREIERGDLVDLLDDLRRTMGVRRRVRLLEAREPSPTAGPALFGVARPRIVLPRTMIETWSLDELRAVLLHELAHVRRGDLPVNWIQIAVQTVYFFHPLVWLVNACIRRERESACDDLAIRHSAGRSRGYGLSLLRVAEESRPLPAPAFAGVGMTEGGSTLGRRVRRIVGNDYRVKSSFTATSVLALVLVASLAVALSGEGSNTQDSMSSRVETIQRMIARWNFAEAIPAAEALLAEARDDKTRAAAHLLLARAYDVQGVEYREPEALSKARDHVSEAFRLNGDLRNELDVARLVAHVAAYRQPKSVSQEAIDAAQDNVTSFPQNAQAHFALGMTHHALAISGNYAYTKEEQDRERELAIASMKRAIELDPRRYEFWAYYVTALNNAGRKDEACCEAERMMREADLAPEGRAPSTNCPWELYAAAVLEPEKYGDYLKEQQRQNPKDAELEYVLAVRYQRDGTPERRKALEEFLRKIESGDLVLPIWKSRLEVSALYMLADEYHRIGDLEKALAIYDRVVALSPDYAQVRYNRAAIRVEMASKTSDRAERRALLEQAKADADVQRDLHFHDDIAHSRELLKEIEGELAKTR